MRTIERDIVGAFIFSGDEQLLLGKSILGGVYQDLWVVPGGGINPDETELDAVKREVLEEVGLDISNAHIEAIDGESYGESRKQLRDTQEIVLVKMTFHDFLVRLLLKASDVDLKFEDDLADARWFTKTELQDLELAPGTAGTLKKLGII